jgi:hypothetical protein
MSSVSHPTTGHTALVPPDNSKSDSYDNDFSYDEKVFGSGKDSMRDFIRAMDQIAEFKIEEENAAAQPAPPAHPAVSTTISHHWSGARSFAPSAGFSLVDHLVPESAPVAIPSETTRVSIRTAGFLDTNRDTTEAATPSEDDLLSQMALGSHLSSAVYCFKPQDCRNFPPELISAVPYYSERLLLGRTQIGMFATYDSNCKFIRVVYRGSSTLSQWATNAKISPYQCGNDFGKAHSGFVSMYLGTRQQLWKSVAELMDKFDDHAGIQFTGHSLGGALAVLATCDFKLGLKVLTIGDKKFATSDLFPFDPEAELSGEELVALGVQSSTTFQPNEAFQSPPVKVLYTYGQPLIGNQKFADNVNKLLGEKNYYRVSNGRDMVCTLPPTAFGFCHAGIAVHFRAGSADEFTIGQLLDEDRGIISGVTLYLWNNLIQLMPTQLTGVSESERRETLIDLLIPSVADHLYYVGVDYDAVFHTVDCTPKRVLNPTEPTSSPCSIM